MTKRTTFLALALAGILSLGLFMISIWEAAHKTTKDEDNHLDDVGSMSAAGSSGKAGPCVRR